MNGRIAIEETPEGRLAAVVKGLIVRMREEHRNRLAEYREPDYADIRDALRPHVERELVLARIAEVEWSKIIDFRPVRLRELKLELAKAEAIIASVIIRQ